jgi:hypothetical protein
MVVYRNLEPETEARLLAASPVFRNPETEATLLADSPVFRDPESEPEPEARLQAASPGSSSARIRNTEHLEFDDRTYPEMEVTEIILANFSRLCQLLSHSCGFLSRFLNP